MIKVLKIKTRKCTCPICRTKFSFEPSDIEKKLKDHDFFDKRIMQFCVQCPTCKYDIVTRNID